MDHAFVSIVAPVYNEEPVIESFIERISDVICSLESKYVFEIILVDDGSSDHSLEKMKHKIKSGNRLRIIELCRNYGQTAAIQAGLDSARGDIIITLDADLQHFPEEIPSFLEKIEEGYDMVCGWRSHRAEGMVRRWPSRIANYFLKRISGVSVHDFGTTFRAYRKELVKELMLLGEFHRFIPALGQIVGAKISEITIQNIERPRGKSNYGLGRTFGVFLDLILLYFFTSYMDRPIRIFGKISALLFSLGMLILSALVVYAYIHNVHAVLERQGWFILSVMLVVSAGQTLLTGILAEILIRVHYGQNNKRVYRTRCEWNADTKLDN